MQKILLVIDGTTINTNSLDFAAYLGKLTKSKLTGVFLENLPANEQPVLQQSYGVSYLNWEVDKENEDYKKKQQQIEANILFFKEACDKRSVRCAVHKDRGQPAREIINESRYADLLVIDAGTSFSKKFEGVPSEFATEILNGAECPVIIAPESFDGIEEIVLTYNGTRSSIFAIKQFCYLFPEFGETKVTVLQVDEHGLVPKEEIEKFREWISDHYSSIGFHVLEGDAETQLFCYLLKKKNVVVVLGAYGRSAVSQYFKHSQANLLIKTFTQPIFIAHL